MNRPEALPPVRAVEKAAVQAGCRYQVLFRILDHICDLPVASVGEGAAMLSDDALAGLFLLHHPDVAEGERRQVVMAFLAEDPEALAMPDLTRAVSAYKRRGLREFMAVVRPISEANRRRRLGSDTPRVKPFDDAMTVSQLQNGHGQGRIVRAAILYKGFVWSKPAPKRHSDIINEMFDILGEELDAPQAEGFVSSSGHFLDRREALLLARASGQTFLEEPPDDELFSENLW
jgi:hypothetical protein